MWNHLHSRPKLWIFQGFKLISILNDKLKDQHIDHEVEEDSVYHGRQLLEAPSAYGIVPSCVPPSINEFPDDFFTQEQRLQGGIIVHILIVVYVWCMLGKVCDRYFVPSLGVMSSYFNVSSDIAGATFMAMGASSPELFASAIGAFATEGDIGVGTVVGSAVFNILAVTGVGGLAVGAMAIQLDWYPISRDCSMYLVTISVLIYCIHDNIVTWIEATVLLLMFVVYLLVLYFNNSMKNATIGMVSAIGSWCNCGSSDDDLMKLPHTVIDETSALIVSRFPSKYESFDDSACPSSTASSLEASFSSGSETFGKESGQFDPQFRSSDISKQDFTAIKFAHEVESETERSLSCRKEEMEEEKVSLCTMPEGIIRKALWLFMWPANLLLFITIPDCTTESGRKWFPLTFIASIMWLGVLSYISFWMVAIIGYTLGIPDTVSGITILAAGNSVPELVASIIVIRSGLGNMALCNLISSNIFDILFCLGAPWLVKSLLNTETKSLVINSSALTYTTLILLGTVVLFYIALFLCKWKLSWRTGIIALSLYIIFLVFASLYESNIFGDFNPPPCDS